MDNTKFLTEEFIKNTSSEVLQLFMAAGLELNDPEHRESCKWVLVRTAWALLAENGQVNSEVLKSHVDDYTAKLAAMAIPEDELRRAGLLPLESGLN